MTALVGAVGTGSSLTGVAEAAAFAAPADHGKFDFDEVYSRVGTDSVKYDQQMRIYGKENVQVGMGIADMDFRCAPAITRALNERMKHEVWGYLDTPPAYTEGIINWNKRRYGLDVNPDLLALTNGVHPGLIAALKTFSPPGSKVLLNTPTYNGFYGDLTYTGTKPEENPLKFADGKFSIDFEDFERRISHDTNTYILCNPQNPTGNCWSAEDLMRLGEICLRRRVVVLADEIHCDFVTKGNKYTPFASLPNKAVVNNSITFKAGSKSFGLAAMKCAWMFSDNADYMARVKANHRPDLSTLGVVANRAAYADGEDWLNQVVAYIDGNHDFVQSYVKAHMPMIKVGAKPQGTYLTWVDVSYIADKINAKQLAADASKKQAGSMRPLAPEQAVERWLVMNAKVQLNPGNTYGLGGANHMRMNIATSRKTLELALGNIAAAVSKL
jgi:cystathionine beta-lyase